MTPVAGSEQRSLVEIFGLLRPRNDRKALIFDGDDTLWSTEPLYDAARAQAASIVGSTGLDPDEWGGIERRLDVQNVGRFGLSADRFPTSCVEAYELLCKRSGVAARADIADAVRRAAMSVFSATAPVFPGVESTLTSLSREYAVYLLTQGDVRVQRQRISESGLAKYFDGVFITPMKTTEVLREVLEVIASRPTDATLIGNSVASDINPALAAGVHAVWIDAHVWDHERREGLVDPSRVVVLSRIDELAAALT